MPNYGKACGGDPAAFLRAMSRTAKYLWVGDSQGNPFTHDTTDGNQGIRIPFGVRKNWDRDWTYMTHPGSYGSISAGTAIVRTVGDVGTPTSVTPGTAIAVGTGVNSVCPNDLMEMTWVGNADAAANPGSAYVRLAQTGSLTYYNGSNWYDGQTLRGKIIYADAVYGAGYEPLGVAGRRSSMNASTGFTPSGDGTLKAVDVAIPDHASAEASIHVRGGANNEATKPARLAFAGGMIYKASGSNLVDGAGWDTISHAGFTAYDHLAGYDDLAIGRWCSLTVAPSTVFLMLGHNAETDDFSGNDVTQAAKDRMDRLVGRIIVGAAYARNIQAVTYPTDIFIVVPWLASTSGGMPTVAKATSLRNAWIDVAERRGVNWISLFDYFGQQNPLANSSHLHPNATGGVANTDIRTIVTGLESCLRSRVASRYPRLRNRGR